MKIKATHLGECQVCGRTQKLPGGLLSKHGYTVDWGFFSGVCWGEGHLPFQQDKSLIESAIKGAEASIVQIEEEAKTIRARQDLRGFYHSYEGNAYVWRVVEFSLTDMVIGGRTFPTIVFVACDKGVPFKHPQVAHSRGFYAHGVEAIAAESRERYCSQKLDKHAADLRRYISWQRERIKNWAVKPLTPIGGCEVNEAKP